MYVYVFVCLYVHTYFYLNLSVCVYMYTHIYKKAQLASTFSYGPALHGSF